MEYLIVSASTAKEVEEQVNALMGEEWEPLGGLSASLSEDDNCRYMMFAQAMIRKEEKP